MKLFVGGEDRSGDLGRTVEKQSDRLAAHPDVPLEWEPFHSALFLREAQDNTDYITKLIDLLVLKSETSSADFYIQRRPGAAGAAVAFIKKYLWRWTRYQHDHVRFQQNTVNTQLAIALQFLLEQHQSEVGQLRDRVDLLEEKQCRDA